MTDPKGNLGGVTTPFGGGTADLVAELRAQAEAAVVRAAETAEQVAREVVEVREQADAVAAALEAGARQAAEAATADGRAEATPSSPRPAPPRPPRSPRPRPRPPASGSPPPAYADDAQAALARAEVRRESAAVQADALRLTARREATMHRRQQLDDTHQVGNGQLDAVSDVVARLGVTLESLSQSIAEVPPPPPGCTPTSRPTARAGGRRRSEAGRRRHPTRGRPTSAGASDSDPPGCATASELLRRVRHRCAGARGRSRM